MPPNPITKRLPILRAAADIFLHSGFSGASMDAIAEAASVAKATLYNQFGNKQALFEAIVRSRCEQLLETATRFDSRAAEPAVGLAAVGRAYVGLHYASQFLELLQLAIAEQRNFPDLVVLVFQTSQEPAQRRLTDYLRWLDRRQALRITDAEVAAQQFLGMLTGETHMRCLLGLRGGLTSDEADALIGAAVALFCAGKTRCGCQ
ncbi:MAG: helix-turn-helix transcriptional regulator [Methylococcaceae bacterium]|nr:helix-turn-helix transcriptional regulator [Methylococcaceae bacterium]